MAELAMSSSMRIKGPGAMRGELAVPGDKSLSHRVAMLASIARGPSHIRNFASSMDCHSTLACIEQLGARIERTDQSIIIHGTGLRGYRPAEAPVHLNAGNSGSTIRMLSGILAAQRFTSVIDGDGSLRRRPMRRIIEPLGLMGVRITATEQSFAPLTIEGAKLRAIHYASRVASAQVKTCVLFAGLHTEGRTEFTEPALSRNHTELMLAEFGARIEVDETTHLSIRIEGGTELTPVDYRVAGDVSSAAFFIAAATALADSSIVLRAVNLNPTRTAFIDMLKQLGADIVIHNVRPEHGELIGDIQANSSRLKTPPQGFTIAGDIIPNLIDEIPMLAVVATQVEGRVEVRGAKELRIKESDRIKTVVAGIRSLGGEIDEFDDGFVVQGPQRLRGSRIETEGDHRIAMAFAIAGLMADGTTEIIDADCAGVSFPEFYELLDSATGGAQIER
jgi:3-phosphoshikimate 1-carboxyvinyltransferase